MNDSKGFTLLDLLIGLVVIGVIGSIVGGVFFGVLFTPKSIASQSAQSYVDQINGVGGDGAKLIGCLSADNDGGRDGELQHAQQKDRRAIHNALRVKSLGKVYGWQLQAATPFHDESTTTVICK